MSMGYPTLGFFFFMDFSVNEKHKMRGYLMPERSVPDEVNDWPNFSSVTMQETPL